MEILYRKTNLRPSIEATKQALRCKEVNQREGAWERLTKKGIDPLLRELFDDIYSQAYWTGAMDMVQDTRAKKSTAA